MVVIVQVMEEKNWPKIRVLKTVTYYLRGFQLPVPIKWGLRSSMLVHSW